jgi:hypothetical protein
MFAQEWETLDGAPIFAEQDSVRIRALNPDGSIICSILQTPEAAIALALTIQDAAVKAMQGPVDDDGAKPSLTARMARYNNAYKQARP